MPLIGMQLLRGYDLRIQAILVPRGYANEGGSVTIADGTLLHLALACRRHGQTLCYRERSIVDSAKRTLRDLLAQRYANE